LIAAIASILGMFDDGQSYFSSDLNGPVLAAVVDKDDLVDRAGRHVGEGGGQSAFGIVGRHDSDDLVPAFSPGIRFGTKNSLDPKDFVPVLKRRFGQKRHRKIPKKQMKLEE